MGSVVDEGGFFELTGRNGDGKNEDDEMVAKIIALKSENFPSEIDMIIKNIRWTEQISSLLVQTFDHYETFQRWHEGYFYDCDQSDRCCAVIRRIGEIELFQKLTFDNEIDFETELSAEYAASIASSFSGLKILRRVSLYNFSISQDAMSALAEGLLSTADTICGIRELEFGNSRFGLSGNEESDSENVAQKLAAGLSRNVTLECLILKDTYLEDSSLSFIVDSLVGHPKLKALRLLGNEVSTETCGSLSRMLASPTCKLVELQISDYLFSTSGDTVFNTQRLSESLPIPNTIKILDLSENTTIDATDMNIILTNLWRCPSLLALDLSENNIEDLVVATTNLASSYPTSQIRTLDLDDNACFDGLLNQDIEEDNCIVQAILKLLNVFPSLGHLGEDFMDIISQDYLPAFVQHQTDMNRCVGTLTKVATMPLSLWPLVIARAGKDRFLENETSRLTSVIYSILQGPAFVGRDSFG